ncbi:hypothetical protein Tco_0723549 [Tanacetum coccineum]
MDTSKRGTIAMQPNVDLRKSQGPSTPAEVKRMKGIPYALGQSDLYMNADRRCTRPMRCDDWKEYLSKSTTQTMNPHLWKSWNTKGMQLKLAPMEGYIGNENLFCGAWLCPQP